MKLYIGQKTRSSSLRLQDLHTADWEFVLRRTEIAFVVYSTHTGIGSFYKNHPLSKHVFIDIVNTTKVHTQT